MRTSAQQINVWQPHPARRRKPLAYSQTTLSPAQRKKLEKVLEAYQSIRALVKDPPRPRMNKPPRRAAPLRRVPIPEKVRAEKRAELIREKIAQGKL